MTDDARRALLHELIDDAGLFPPASLSMDAAAEQHAAARGGPHAWMLGRFICPASRLEELRKHLDLLDRWRLSVIVDEPEGAAELASWLEDPPPGAAVEIVEAPPAMHDLGAAGAAVDGHGIPAFLEVPPGEPLDPVLSEIAERGREAKLRTGGATAGHFPAPETVAAFLDGCRRRDIRCKVTAGLHHPFRHTDAETGFVRHGFLNLVGAAVLASAHDLGPGALAPVVEDTEPGSFTLTAARFAWRDLEADPGRIARARRDLFFAYGSCSFDEPVEDLLALGILPA